MIVIAACYHCQIIIIIIVWNQDAKGFVFFGIVASTNSNEELIVVAFVLTFGNFGSILSSISIRVTISIDFDLDLLSLMGLSIQNCIVAHFLNSVGVQADFF